MKTEFSIGAVSAGLLAEMCGGELREGSKAGIETYGLCTDSREADAATAFVALRGDRVDGHDFIEKALAAGCRCVLCEHSNEAIEACGAAAIVVRDTEFALATLANAFRQRLTCHTVAVTGSVGKTTTKDLISSVLSVRHKTYKTEGNRNSLVGMPLSVTEIPQDTEWAVLEMGMSNFGEIERLSIAAEPDYAIITNIGSAHLEMLGSRANICRAKLEILCGLRDGGTLLLNGDEPLLRRIGGKSYRTVYISLEGNPADFSAKNIRVGVNGTLFDLKYPGGEARDLRLRLVGKHNVYDAVFAFAVGYFSGMTPEEIGEGLYAFQSGGFRQHLTECCGVSMIEDCYNASPESMIASIDVLKTFAEETGSRSIAVLGDMLELGDDTPALHRKVGGYLARQKIDLLFTFGRESGQIAWGARQFGMPMSTISQNPDSNRPETCADALAAVVKPGDVILFKASRAIGAERIISLLKERLQSGEEKNHE